MITHEKISFLLFICLNFLFEGRITINAPTFCIRLPVWTSFDIHYMFHVVNGISVQVYNLCIYIYGIYFQEMGSDRIRLGLRQFFLLHLINISEGNKIRIEFMSLLIFVLTSKCLCVTKIHRNYILIAMYLTNFICT